MVASALLRQVPSRSWCLLHQEPKEASWRFRGRQQISPLATRSPANALSKTAARFGSCTAKLLTATRILGGGFLSGDEDQAYADDPNNMGLYAVGTIAAIDPSVVPLLHTEPPCPFERETASQAFRPSKGFNFTPDDPT